jgi:hypothetical protein
MVMIQPVILCNREPVFLRLLNDDIITNVIISLERLLDSGGICGHSNCYENSMWKPEIDAAHEDWVCFIHDNMIQISFSVLLNRRYHCSYMLLLGHTDSDFLENLWISLCDSHTLILWYILILFVAKYQCFSLAYLWIDS